MTGLGCFALRQCESPWEKKRGACGSQAGGPYSSSFGPPSASAKVGGDIGAHLLNHWPLLVWAFPNSHWLPRSAFLPPLPRPSGTNQVLCPRSGRHRTGLGGNGFSSSAPLRHSDHHHDEVPFPRDCTTCHLVTVNSRLHKSLLLALYSGDKAQGHVTKQRKLDFVHPSSESR